MELNILDCKLRIASIKKEGISKYMHAFIRIGILAKPSCHFFSLTQTSDEYTVIIDADRFNELPSDPLLHPAVDVWVPLCVSPGPYTLSGITSITRTLILPLADSGISIFCLSSHQTDYILVKEAQVSAAMECLSTQHTVERHSQGTTIPLDRVPLHDNPALPPSNPRLITHHFVTPCNKFYITSINESTLATVGVTVIESLFYPPQDETETLPGEESENFFSMTRVHNDTTLVMDCSILSKFPSNCIYVDAECWKMIKIGDQEDDLGFSECGIVAQISDPIARADISEYYISAFCSDHTLVPENSLEKVLDLLNTRLAETRSVDLPPVSDDESSCSVLNGQSSPS